MNAVDSFIPNEIFKQNQIKVRQAIRMHHREQKIKSILNGILIAILMGIMVVLPAIIEMI